MAATDQVEKLKLVLTEEEAEAVIAQGTEVITFYLLALSKRIQEIEQRQTPSSSTPSGMIVSYQKPRAPKRRKKPGQKPGHVGTRRAPPPKVDRTEDHCLTQCPHCQSPVDPNKPTRTRKRVIEDLQESTPEAVEHCVHGHWCPVCRKIVEPVVVDAMPKATIGHRALALTAWLHDGVGITLSQIVEVLNHHFHFKVSPGGLVQMWYRIQAVFHAWYEQIEKEARDSSYLHADESGWRVNGSTNWLWCFTNKLPPKSGLRRRGRRRIPFFDPDASLLRKLRRGR